MQSGYGSLRGCRAGGCGSKLILEYLQFRAPRILGQNPRQLMRLRGSVEEGTFQVKL